MEEKFQISARLKSFVYAFNGIKIYFKTQHNVWIHLSIALLVFIAGLLLNISFVEWCLVLLAMGFTREGNDAVLSGFGLDVSPDGGVCLDEGGMASLAGVFVAGDLYSGASLIVRAIAHGRGVAERVHAFLEG